MKRNKKRILIYVCIVLLLGVLGYSLYRYLSIQKDYRDEKTAHNAVLRFQPSLPENGEPILTDPDMPNSEASAPGQSVDPGSDPENPAVCVPITNESILQLQAEYPDAVGWITVPGTDVDYPFVQFQDNSYYLRRGIDGKYLYAGVPFLDYRCAADLSGGNSIIYGHNLRNGTMFGTLTRFKDRSFFDEHRYFYVFLAHDTIQAEIIACIVMTPDQVPYIYEPYPDDEFASRCVADARCSLSGFTSSGSDRFITLSTCDYEKNNSRVILIGRIVE